MATVATGTSTTSATSSSSTTFGNVFSEAVTGIGTALSKLLPEEAELDTAAGTFLTGLVPDLMSGSLIDIGGAIVGGGLALLVGLSLPEGAVLAGAAAAVGALVVGADITENALKQNGYNDAKLGLKKNAQSGGRNGSGEASQYNVVIGGNHWEGHTVSGHSFLEMSRRTSANYGASKWSESYTVIGKLGIGKGKYSLRNGKTTDNWNEFYSPDLVKSGAKYSKNYGRTTTHNSFVETPAFLQYSGYQNIDNGKTLTSTKFSDQLKRGGLNTFSFRGTTNFGKTTIRSFTSFVFGGSPTETSAIHTIVRTGTQSGVIPGYYYSPGGESLGKTYQTDRVHVRKTSSNFGETTLYKRMQTGPQTEYTFKNSVGYGKNIFYEKTSSGSGQAGETIDYGATRTYDKWSANGTFLKEASYHHGATKTYSSKSAGGVSVYQASRHSGATKTYDRRSANGAYVDQRSQNFGATRTYTNGRTYQRSIATGRTTTYNNGVTSAHSVNNGRTITQANSHTYLKAINNGASYSEVLNNGRTSVQSVNNGATFTETKNGGATYIREVSGGRSYTYVHGSTELIDRNFGNSYIYGNGAEAFAYSPVLGGTYFSGSGTSVGNGSIARAVLGLTKNAALPIIV